MPHLEIIHSLPEITFAAVDLALVGFLGKSIIDIPKDHGHNLIQTAKVGGWLTAFQLVLANTEFGLTVLPFLNSKLITSAFLIGVGIEIYRTKSHTNS